MNEYLLRKFEENDVKLDNLIGFYWDGLHEDEGLVRCSFSEMPRILSHDYILLKCEICGNEFYKRLIDVLPTCHRCNSQDHYNSMRVDWKSEISKITDEFELLGYLDEGEFISESNINKLPLLGCSDYIKLKCVKCGLEIDRRLNHVKEHLGCQNCLSKLRGFNQRSDWKSRIIDFESEWNQKLLGYYESENYIEYGSNNLPSLTKRYLVRFKCLTCNREYDRWLTHLDYGCPHGLRKNPIYEYGEFDSKFGKLVYNSSYERKFIELILQLSNLTKLVSQPDDYIIPYNWDDGSEHLYYPDFYLEYSSKKYIIEIKPSTDIESNKVQWKIDASLKYLNNLDITYVLISDDELFSDNPLEDIKYRLDTEDNLKNINDRSSN